MDKQKSLNRGETIFFLGDKVMQIRNNYDLGVFNGDIGKVVDVIDDEGLCIDFDGNMVKYENRELEELYRLIA